MRCAIAGMSGRLDDPGLTRFHCPLCGFRYLLNEYKLEENKTNNGRLSRALDKGESQPEASTSLLDICIADPRTTRHRLRGWHL